MLNLRLPPKLFNLDPVCGRTNKARHRGNILEKPLLLRPARERIVQKICDFRLLKGTYVQNECMVAEMIAERFQLV